MGGGKPASSLLARGPSLVPGPQTTLGPSSEMAGGTGTSPKRRPHREGTAEEASTALSSPCSSKRLTGAQLTATKATLERTPAGPTSLQGKGGAAGDT